MCFCPAGSPGKPLVGWDPPPAGHSVGPLGEFPIKAGREKARSFGLLGRIWLIEAIIVYNSLLLRASPALVMNRDINPPPPLPQPRDDELGARK